MKKYPYIKFQRLWSINAECYFELGQCNAIIQAISNAPLQPDYHEKLLNVSLVKGAQATTAIEGNTLTDKDIEKINMGDSLPPSKEYLETEVKNILNAFNRLLRDITIDEKEEIVSPELIKKLHKLVGQNLGKHFQAVPGQFRKNNVIVGSYKAPDYKDIPILIDNFCSWLQEEFHYKSGQSFIASVMQSIISHVYLEWIHPFSDGNGRTGRLLEFYLLIRAGNPDIASHILSNYYNETRTEYYRQLDLAYKKQDLTQFLHYAVKGFRDGLLETLKTIQKNLFEISWKKYIYDTFSEKKYTKKEVFKRKRDLILEIPMDHSLSLEEISLINPRIAKIYATYTERTLRRDLEELIELKLVVKEKETYRANNDILRTQLDVAVKKRSKIK
jgi:Fic family protein